MASPQADVVILLDKPNIFEDRDMSEQWLSIVDYARTFAVSDMTIRRRIKTGKIQAVLRDGKYFIQVGKDQAGNPVRLDIRADNSPSGGVSRGVPYIDDIERVSANLAHSTEPRKSTSMEKPHRAAQQLSQVTGNVVKSRVSMAPVNSSAGQTTQDDRRHESTEEPTPSLQQQSHSYYESGLIPGHIKLGIQESATSLVESKALLDFCESVLRRFSRLEARLEEGFKSKVALLENQMNAKDQEVIKLKQQIEDLQLLVKILERNP